MKTPIRMIIPVVLVCLVVAPQASAICQEGCLTNANTVLGDDAFLTNTGFGNTAIGYQALMSNTSGETNIAIGYTALHSNTTGDSNTAIGNGAMFLNTTGFENIAIGDGAFYLNTTGTNNVAIGYGALKLLTTGYSNIALGWLAGFNLTTGINNIDIGNEGVAGESNKIRIGKPGIHGGTYIAGIRQIGLTQGTALAVGIAEDGQLGVRASSARFKEAIKPMASSSEAILSLKPVTFHYKKELDPKATPQYGLVAEDVAKVDPDLVARDDQGKPFTVRYEEVNTMLLNEFLKEHKKVEEQASQLADQKNEIAELKTALKAVTARLDAKGL